MSRKPLLTLVAVPAASLLGVIGLTACGGGGGAEAVVVQAAATPQFLSQSADRTAAVDSGRFEISIDVPASDEVPEQFSIKGSGAFDLAANRSQITIDFGGLVDAAQATGEDSAALSLFGDGTFQVITDGTTAYLQAGFLNAFLGGDDSKPWVKVPAGEIESGQGLDTGFADATALLELLRDEGATVTDEGDAEVDGTATRHFSATISVEDALAASPPEAREKARSMLDELGSNAANAELPLDVFVDGDGFVRRMQMTFDGDAFAAFGAGDEAPTGPITVTVDYLDLGEAVDIELPPADQVADSEALAEMFQGD